MSSSEQSLSVGCDGSSQELQRRRSTSLGNSNRIYARQRLSYKTIMDKYDKIKKKRNLEDQKSKYIYCVRLDALKWKSDEDIDDDYDAEWNGVPLKNDIELVFKSKTTANQYANDLFYEMMNEEFKSKRWCQCLVNGYIRDIGKKNKSLPKIPMAISGIINIFIHKNKINERINEYGLFSNQYKCWNQEEIKIYVEKVELE